ncbi:dephospho-CoA kinase [Bacillus seohaeanensis]|jgi:dephospho-CoA kinase|uniref:Dephospho-CoA kinase n=1 Tax=Bacillus seohaeanensis TaxID=284580 RepID=A0ABW5RS91_9BACI
MGMVIGLTGGIASGKSTVSTFLKHKGFTVVDADIAARTVVEVGKPAYNEIVTKFGKEILCKENNKINREKLGSIVFSNEEKRNLLNGIVHPAVRKEMLDQKEKAFASGKRTVIMDIPLLYESNLTWMVDRTIVVYVDAETQLNRLMERNSLSKEDALARIDSQFPLKDKVSLADVVIDNNGSITNTEFQLEELLERWNLIP